MPGPEPSRTTEPLIPLDFVKWALAAIAVVVVVVLVITLAEVSSHTSVPAGCPALVQAVDQLGTDLNAARQASSSGPIDPTNLDRDVGDLQTVISGNPGIAARAQRVFDATAQLLGDVQRKTGNQGTDFIAIGQASASALSFCGVPTPPGVATP